MRVSNNYRRAGLPWLLAECVVLVAMLRGGEPVQQIALRLQRRIGEIRAVIYGSPA